MSNCEVFELPVVEAVPHQVREVLRCLLHTILFNRALGMVKPKDVDSELLDMSWVAVSDPELEKAVEARVSECCASVERRPSAEPLQVCLSFFERRQRQVATWFGPKDERLYWEQWRITINLAPPAPSAVVQPSTGSFTAGMPIPIRRAGEEEADAAAAAAQRERTFASLQAALLAITRCVCDRRELPPVVSSSPVPYPWELTVASGPARAPSFSLGNVKRMLVNTIPPSMI